MMSGALSAMAVNLVEEKEVGGHAPLDGAAAIRVHVTSNLAWIKNLSLLGD